MALVTVTATIGATCHYWLTPQPVVSLTGNGLSVLDIVHGFADGHDSPVALSFSLEDSARWDIHLAFEGAPPVEFTGLDVSGGGDLFSLLTAQGWIHL